MIMGFDRKYGQVTTEHGEIPADEPVIVFRARDVNTFKLLGYYLVLCSKGGSPRRHLELILDNLDSFGQWQEANPDKVGTPDSERSRAWMDH
jgi:hypothetical protein